MSEFVVGESRYSSAERALKGTREWAKSRGIDVSDDTIVGNIKRVAPDKLPGGAKLSPLQSQSVFREAERAFKAMGKEAPKNPGAVLKHFSATMRRAAPFIAIPAVSVGIASAFNVRRKRKALAHLRKTAEDQSMLDRAQQAAPGLATLPGFALGAADTQTFDPRNLIGERAGRALGAPKGLKSRIVSGLVGAGALSTAAALPGMLRDSAHAVGGSKPAAAATAPIIIQKKAAALPHMLDELDKIARRTEQLDLKPRAWDLGIHAKKTDQDHRGIAYTHGVGGVAAAGAVGAGTQGAVLGRSLLAMRHASARRQALEEAVTDAAQLVKANLQARANFATSAGRTALDQAKAGVGMGDAAASSVESGLRGAANSVDTSKLTEIARRRGKAGLKAGLGGAALFGGAKLLSNAAKYHTSKSLTTAPNERNS